MRKRSASLILVLLLVPALAWADRHKAGIRVAGAKSFRSSLLGVQLGGEFPLHGHPPGETASTPGTPATKKRPLGTLAMVAELSLVAGTHEDETLDQFTLVVGPRYTVGHSRFQPFLHALVGGARLSRGEIRTPPAAAFGGGCDIPWGSVAMDGDHPGHPRIAIRVQADGFYLRAQPTDWYLQVSIGVVVRFNR
jgi:hypothetical protein